MFFVSRKVYVRNLFLIMFFFSISSMQIDDIFLKCL